MTALKFILNSALIIFLLACNRDQSAKGSDSEKESSDSLKNEFSDTKYPEISRDLKDIQKEGTLKVVTMFSSTNYFLYRGQPMGYEYELINRLADDFKLRVELVVVRNIKELVEKLKNGEGDLIAAGLTITNDRKHYLRFTNDLYLTKQVLVQRKPTNWRKMMLHQIEQTLIRDPIDLINDTVYVRKNSSYFNRLVNLEEEMGGNIHIVPVSDKDTEKLIAMVVEGKIKYTVADKNLADVNAAYYPILDTKTPLSFSQRIAWAVRKSSPNLADTLNIWIDKMKKYNDYYAIYDRYYKSPRSSQKRVNSDFFSEKTGKISPYDDIIKTHAKNINWDWRLIASLVYQESHFNPSAKSWAHASGLMQLMPATAEEMGIKDIHNANDNIRGGVKYLKKLWDYWENIPDSTERFKFTFASYNCGMHHVEDAQRLAQKNDMNPLIWDNNVEEQVMNLSYSKYYRDPDVHYGYVRGREPVAYVREIFERYDQYKTFIDK